MSNIPRAGVSFIKTVSLILCLALCVGLFKLKRLHNTVPTLLRSALADLKLEEKGLTLSFEKASVSLVGSLSHPFGLRIKDLDAEYTKDCNQYELSVGTVVLPLKVLSFYKSNKIDLGLVRLSEVELKHKELCAVKTPRFSGTKKSAPSELNRVIRSKNKTEEKIVKLFSKIKKINTDFMNRKKSSFSIEGVFIYDFKLATKEKNRLEVSRFKALLGAGELKYKADWSSKLYIEDLQASLKGSLVGYADRLEASLVLKKKESLLETQVVSYLDFNQKDLVRLNFQSVPLSFISKLKSIDFAGINLRKTWLESSLDLEVSKSSLDLEISQFKIYGDFGLIETDVNTPELRWAGESWGLSQPAQLRLQKINFFEILRERPRKKIAEVFKDVGHFNALVKLGSLDAFTGDFETNDFSVLIRSQGKKAYQKVKSAKGSLSFKKKEHLSFKLEDIDLEQGDFEGSVALIYDYKQKDIKTKFDIQHLKFNSKIAKELLLLEKDLDISLRGKGFVSKAKLTKPGDIDYRSELQFEFGSASIASKSWAADQIASDCIVKNKILNCKLSIGELTVSDKLKVKLGLKLNKFTGFQSSFFSFENKVLVSKISNRKLSLDLEWRSEVGMSVSSESFEPVLIRGL